MLVCSVVDLPFSLVVVIVFVIVIVFRFVLVRAAVELVWVRMERHISATRAVNSHV